MCWNCILVVPCLEQPTLMVPPCSRLFDPATIWDPRNFVSSSGTEKVLRPQSPHPQRQPQTTAERVHDERMPRPPKDPEEEQKSNFIEPS
jgi:hypothetical protein